MSRGPEKSPFFQLWTPLEGAMVIVDLKYLTRDVRGHIWSTPSIWHLWVLTFTLKNWCLKLGFGVKNNDKNKTQNHLLKGTLFYHFSKCQDDISKVSLLLWSCIELLSKQEERGVTIPIFYHHPLPQQACYPFSKNHSIVATSSIVNNNNSLFLNDNSLPNWNCQSNAL